MQVVNDVNALRTCVAGWRQRGDHVAFVPTMGNLHDGHLRLVSAAQASHQRVVVSIFVNPLQFAPDEDFSTYPRTFDEDKRKLIAENVDLLFCPDIETLYPDGKEASCYIETPGLSDILEGRCRPGFFRGVATVVNKLFNLVQPDTAFFGEKDYQQLLVIRKMVADFAMPIRIEPVATVREADGLAMSSRNQYLQTSQRALANRLYQAMQRLARAVGEGQDIALAQAEACQWLTEQGFSVDYLTVCEPMRLQAPQTQHRSLIVLAAARLGTTRLIDNLRFER